MTNSIQDIEIVHERARRYYRIANLFIVTVVTAILLFSFTYQFDRAIVLDGRLQSENQRIEIRDALGGHIAKIHVENGSSVETGDPILSFSSVQESEELDQLKQVINSLILTQVRLKAQIDLDFQRNLQIAAMSAFSDWEFLETDALDVSKHEAVLEKEVNSYVAQKNRLKNEEIALKSQSESLVEIQLSLTRQIELIEEEISSSGFLLDKGLSQKAVHTELLRSKENLLAERLQIGLQSEETNRRLREIPLELDAISDDRGSELFERLVENENQLSVRLSEFEVAENRLALKQVEAPTQGVILQEGAIVSGTFVAPNEPILSLVPEGSDLVFFAKLKPADVSDVVVGSHARLQVVESANRRDIRLNGFVSSIGADVVTEQNAPGAYYPISIKFDPDDAELVSQLRPGSPMTAYISAEPRNLAQFIFSPILNSLEEAVRR